MARRVKTSGNMRRLAAEVNAALGRKAFKENAFGILFYSEE
jgi:hypothetical protein